MSKKLTTYSLLVRFGIVIFLAISVTYYLRRQRPAYLSGIWSAIANDDIEEVRKYISSKGDVNARDKNGWTLLMRAAWDERAKSVKLLLESGADPNLSGDGGQTPLMLCWRSRENTAIASELIKYRANPDALNVRKTPLLVVAISYGNPSLAELLINSGANVSIPDANGKAPLVYAVEQGLDRLVTTLLEKGANANAVDKSGITVLIRACQLLLYQAGNEKLAELLIKRGANPSITDATGKSPLAYAAEYEHTGHLVAFILEKDVDVNTVDQSGETALMLACGHGNLPAVSELVRKKAAINKSNIIGETALFYAVSANQPAIVDLLIDHGANTNAVNGDGITALYKYAGSAGRHAAIARLIQRGADTTKKYPNGKTLRDHVIEADDRELLKLLDKK